MDNNKGVEGIENCGEEQTKQIRSRTALTREGPSSRLLGSLMMRLGRKPALLRSFREKSYSITINMELSKEESKKLII